MATQTSADRRTTPPRVAEAPPLSPARFTVEQYHQMDNAGIFAGKRYELIDGLIVEMPGVNPPHKTAVRRLLTLFPPLVGPDWVVDGQGPITFSASEPMPDLTVSVGPEDRYFDRHASPADVVLVVEVSDSTLNKDRTTKLQMYAAAKIPIYWIVNIPDRVVEVYTQPRGGKSPAYRTRTDYAAGTDIPVVLRGQTVGTVPAGSVLPD